MAHPSLPCSLPVLATILLFGAAAPALAADASPLPLLYQSRSPAMVSPTPIADHAQKPEPIAVTVMATHPGTMPGVETVMLRRVVFQPGASVDLTVDGLEFCHGTTGEWTVTNRDTGVIRTYGPGDRWAGAPLGTRVTVANNGDTPAEQWVVKIIPAK